MIGPRLVGSALLVALLTGCGGQGGSPSTAPTPPPAATPSPTATPAPAAAATPPVRIEIPSIDIDESLIDLGIAANGELETPEDASRVGWYAGGGKPGELYPTVIAGHKDSREGPAIFANLRSVKVGETITVESADGRTFSYLVYEVRDVPQDDRFPTQQVYGPTLAPEIRVITCTGPYDRSIGRYTENRLVFGKLV